MKRRLLYKLCALASAGCLAAVTAGCGQADEIIQETLVGNDEVSAQTAAGTEDMQGQAVSGASENLVNTEEMFTDRDLSSEYDEADCQEIRLDGDNVTVTEEGIYILSGTLENGMIIVDVPDSAKVQLVLDGVTVSNSEGAAIYVKEADKVFVTLAEGSVNASGFGGMFGNRGGNGFGGSGGSILISGGQLYINADGDGIDSNGTLTVSGGEVYVSGPISGDNGALDYDGEGQITGGIVVAVGSAGMAMNFGDTSTQGSILTNSVKGEAGTEIVLKDVVGATLVSYTAEKAFGSVVISCPGLTVGSTYTLSVGDSDTEIVMDSLIYGSGNGFGGFGGGRGGFGGDRENQGGRPDGNRGAKQGEAPELPEMPEGMEKPRNGEMPEMPEMPQNGEMPTDGERQEPSVGL